MKTDRDSRLCRAACSVTAPFEPVKIEPVKMFSSKTAPLADTLKQVPENRAFIYRHSLTPRDAMFFIFNLL